MLEQNINLLFQNPHFLGNRDFGLTFSGGYANSQDVTTYVASKLETGVRLTEHFNQPGSFFSKANTFIYEFDFRRVKVARGKPAGRSRAQSAGAVDGGARGWPEHHLDSRHARLAAGCAPRNLHQLSGLSLESELSARKRSSTGSMFRIRAITASTRTGFVLARNTRYGQERAYGSPSASTDSACRSACMPEVQPRCADFQSMRRGRAIRRRDSRSAAPARW